MGDSRSTLEVDSGLGEGLDVGLKVREVSGRIQGSACAAGWMDNVLDRDNEACGWRSARGRKLKRPVLDVLSLRCQVPGQKSVCGGALWPPERQTQL